MSASSSRTRLLAVLFVSVVAGLPATAQDKAAAKSQYGSVRLGPFYLSGVAPVSAGVDSNVYNTEVGTSDSAAAITPTLQVVLPFGRRARIRSSAGISPQYFHREATERHTDLFLDARGEVDVGPVSAFGGVGRSRYRQRFTLEIDERLERREESDIFGAAAHFGRRVTLYGSQSRRTATFDPEATLDDLPVSASLDRQTVTRRAELAVPVTRKTTLQTFADFVEDRFLHPSPGLEPFVPSRRYGVGVTFSDLAIFNGTFAIGVRHFGETAGTAPYDGLYLSGTITTPFIAKSHLLLSALRDVTYSAIAAADPSVRNTYVASNYRAEVWFDLPLSLRARIFGGYLASDYLVPAGTADSERRQDHGWVEGVALLRQLGRHLSLGGRVQHESRHSPVEGHSYGGYAYGLAGELRF
jgi:hypothetical protein